MVMEIDLDVNLLIKVGLHSYRSTDGETLREPVMRRHSSGGMGDWRINERDDRT